MLWASLSVIFPAGVALYRIQRLRREQVWLACLILLSGLIEGISAYMSHVIQMPNLFLLHIFTVGEFGLITMIYFAGIRHSGVKRWAIYLGIGFSALSILNSLFFERLDQFNTLGRMLEALLVIGLACTYFYLTSQELKVKQLEKDPMFWISAGLVLYFSASFIVYVFSNFIIQKQSLSTQVWAIHAFWVVLQNVFYSIALWIPLDDG